MRSTRLKILGRAACYHVICRITQGQLWLGAEEKVYLMALLHRVAAYCGVEVITFCVMNDHFHLLIKVPEKIAADAAVDDVRLLNRVGKLYGSEVVAELRSLATLDPQAWAEERAMHLNRMHDLSIFMKLLKQRFTMWHNQNHGTRGTLWTERFKSLLVESGQGEQNPLAIVAAYIDLNPVRAGVVEQPEDYAYSGMGSASLGNVESQQGLVALGNGLTLAEVMRWYAELLSGNISELTALLRNRQGALVKGLVLGSVAFVMEVLGMMMSLRKNIRPQRFAAGASISDLWVGRRFRS